MASIIQLDDHTKNLLRKRIKGGFAEFRDYTVTVDVKSVDGEYLITGVVRLDIIDSVDGKASYLLEQSDGTMVEIAPTYKIVSFNAVLPE